MVRCYRRWWFRRRLVWARGEPAGPLRRYFRHAHAVLSRLRAAREGG